MPLPIALLQENAPPAEPFSLWVPLIVMAVFFWLVVLRPNKKEQQRKQAMLAALKKNDRVVTTSGIIGRVATLGERELVLQLDQGRMKVLRSAVASVVDDDGEEKADA